MRVVRWRQCLLLGAVFAGLPCAWAPSPWGVQPVRAEVAGSGYVPPETHFENDLEGWRLVDLDTLQDYSRQGTNFFFGRFDVFGESMMLFTMHKDDPEGVLAFLAPEAFNGNHLPAYNGLLRFRMGTGSSEEGPLDETRAIELRGNGETLSYLLRRPPFDDTTAPQISVPLKESAGWVTFDLTPPTREEFKQVLGNVTELLLPAGWAIYEEDAHTEAVDDVTFVPPGGGQIAVSRVSLNFGRVRLGRSERFEIVVRNVSRTPGDTLRVMPELEGDPSFTLTPLLEEIDIEPRQFLRLRVKFRPSTRGPHNAVIKITHTDGAVKSPVRINVRGVGRRR